MHTALLLIDIQNDFMPTGSLPVAGGDQIVPVANRLAQRFDVVVASQDWHPAGHSSFASSHPDRQAFDVTTVDGLEQRLWPDHCVQGSLGAAFHAALDLQPVTHVIRKGMDARIDSYSAFFDNGHRRSTGLDGLLRALDIDSVVICGLALDVCVQFTALDAAQAGFATVVLTDACRGVDAQPGDIDRALTTLQSAGVQLSTSDALL
ncbi:bifunctional nicotinamidase/pyrazinamidase [Abyssibacter sp.]|mgnify:FL=1|jgi:nicotinamidase/pyrazinamidase|uniref:bifunctional nicotinamidase/pyrazinamidase n=1 Tax=Abyssibacter sp. TaxID=2320200 RepID=UPI0025BB4E73|nr:bifunctional nicotinamidase/pyrazinamidase [Abyssibacter sp.]MCK5859513.1 bifunctional nicotinamidase/pyrazinamidase [Abyssibacter sp.]